MGRIVVPKQINQDSWDAENLLACIVSTPSGMTDLVNRIKLTQNGTADPGRTNPTGTWDAFFDGTTDWFRDDGGTVFELGGQPLTFVWEAILDSFNSANPAIIAQKGNGVSSPARLFYSNDSASPFNDITFGYDSAGKAVRGVMPTGITPTGQRHWGVWNWNGNTVGTASNHNCWINGQALTINTAATLAAVTDLTYIGDISNGVQKWNGSIRQVRVYTNRNWTEGEAFRFFDPAHADELYQERRTQVFFSVTVASPNGSAAETLVALTEAATGKVGARATAVETLKQITETAAGVLALRGSASQALKPVTETGTGRAGALGTAAQTLKALTESASGTTATGNAVTGTTAETLRALTQVDTGIAGARGSAAQSLRALTQTDTGVVAYRGSAAEALKPLTEIDAGRAGAAGQASQTLRALTEVGTGTSVQAGVVTGTTAETLKPLTEVATGKSVTNISASATETLRQITEVDTGRAGALANATNETIRALTQTGTGTITNLTQVSGTATQTLLTLTETHTGRAGARGTVAQALRSLTQISTGLSGAQPIAPIATSGGAGAAGVWWNNLGQGGDDEKRRRRPWWLRDLEDKKAELERQRQIRIDLGILPKDEDKKVQIVTKAVTAFVAKAPAYEPSQSQLDKAAQMIAKMERAIDDLIELDDEKFIMANPEFFFDHRRHTWQMHYQ